MRFPLSSTRAVLFRRFFAFLIVLGLFAGASAANAAGTVSIADSGPKEADNGTWKLKMTINYGGTPPTAHIPMIFSFTPTMHYERALTDQSPEKPVLVKKPLAGQQDININMDVGFSDPAGKTFNITKFDFILRRDHDFEAGEYTLKIKRTNDGQTVGTPQRIVLNGENPIIDRRAIVFTGEKKKDKKTDDSNAAASPEEKKDPPPESTEPSGASEGANEPPVETPPPTPKQSGCGCRIVETSSDPLSVAAAGLLAGLILVRRRRR
jgi:MYXO-CTERM domain-containing protein